LICEGECDDKTACKKKPEEKLVGKIHVTREFCACNNGEGEEDKKCHIVLYTERKKKGGKIEQQYFKCEWDDKNKCPDKTKCAARPHSNGMFEDDPEKLKWMEFECACVPEDEAWPED
jgi:hypothetical protein